MFACFSDFTFQSLRVFLKSEKIDTFRQTEIQSYVVIINRFPQIFDVMINHNLFYILSSIFGVNNIFFFIFLENEDDPSPKNRKRAEKHPLLESCRCKKECLKSFSEVERNRLHTVFWQLDYNHQKAWVFQHVVQTEPNRPTSNENNLSQVLVSKL